MKILQLIQKPQLRGAEIFACQLSNHHLKEGHQVKIVCLFDGPAVLPFSGEIINLKRPKGSRLFDWQGWKVLSRIIVEFQPDIVQANAGDTLKFAVFSKLIFRWHAALVFRNANKVSDFITSKISLVFNRFLVQRVDHVISVSEICRQDLMRTYSIATGKTTMIPIGIETEFAEEEIRDDVKHHFGPWKVIINVASLVPEKNQQALLRMAKNLLEKGEDIRVLLVGDGKLRDTLTHEIGMMGLKEHVFLMGYRNDVPALIKRADVFVLPSLIEGLPGVILEAFYSKTLVVTYNVGGVSEVVEHLKTGWLVAPGNEDDLINAVRSAFRDKQSCMKITETAWQLVNREYNNKRVAREFLNAYGKLISA